MKKKKDTKIKLNLHEAKHDLAKFPWPYKDESISELTCFHRFEYIPARLRIPFMEEIFRILDKGGQASFITTYWTSPRSVQDPTCEWPPICEQSFLYFNKGWRATNQLKPIKCDFDFTYGYQVDPETAARNQESQSFWLKHYLNTATDLQVMLTKR